MAQHDYVIANGTGAAVRSDLNNALAAIVSNNSGSTAPATTYAYMPWADTATGLYKIRNAANSAWTTLYQLDGEWSTIALENGSASAPSIYFKDSGTDTGFYSPGTDQVAVTTGGTQRLLIDASGNVNIDSGTFYVDAANNRVGIGTSSPSVALDCTGAISAQGGNAPSGGFQLPDTSGNKQPRITNDANNATVIRAGSATGGVLFNNFANSANLAILDNSGRLGIGTTSPSRLFQVYDASLAIISAKAGSTEGFFNVTASAVNIESAFGSNVPITFSPNGSLKATLDTSGRLLLGTSSTLAGATDSLLQIRGNSSGTQFAGKVALATDVAAGSIVSGTDLGAIYFGNVANGIGGLIECKGDAQWGTNDYPGRLTFSVTRDGEASPKEALKIDNQGRVTLGTANTPNGIALNVYSSSTSDNDGSLTVGNANTAAAACVASFYTATNSTATSNVLVRFGINSYASGSGQINANGASAAAFGTFSDERLKENIADLASQWDNLKNLRPVEFDYIESEGGGHQIGFIAQEVQEIYPDVVGDRGDGMLTLSGMSKQDARLIKALQEAMERIEALEAEVAALKDA